MIRVRTSRLKRPRASPSAQIAPFTWLANPIGYLPLSPPNNCDYDPKNDTLYACKEGKPRKFYQITDATKPAQRKVSVWEIVDLNTLPAEDLSGLHFDPVTELLHLVSDDSRRWMTIDQTGKITAQISLDKDDTGADKSIKKAEGVTLGPDRILYVVGEPNWLFTFKPTE